MVCVCTCVCVCVCERGARGGEQWEQLYSSYGDNGLEKAQW